MAVSVEQQTSYWGMGCHSFSNSKQKVLILLSSNLWSDVEAIMSAMSAYTISFNNSRRIAVLSIFAIQN